MPWNETSKLGLTIVAGLAAALGVIVALLVWGWRTFL